MYIFSIYCRKNLQEACQNLLNYFDLIICVFNSIYCRNFGVLGNLIKSYKLHEHQLSPFAIYEEESVDGFVRGLTTQPTQSMDASFSAEVLKKINSLLWNVDCGVFMPST